MSAVHIDKLSFIFIDSLKDIISKMAGISFDVLSEEIDSCFEDITGVMTLNGKNHGVLFISANERVMKIISSFMTGIQLNDISKDDLDDAICELVNMTAGNAKLRANNIDQTFTLTPPFVITGENMTINTKKRINVISRVLGNNEISIKLKIVFYS